MMVMLHMTRMMLAKKRMNRMLLMMLLAMVRPMMGRIITETARLQMRTTCRT